MSAPKKNREGSAFISAIMFSSIVFIMSASFLLMTSSEYMLNNRSYGGVVAINLAEAGADYAINALNLMNPSDPDDISNWSGTDPDPKTKSLSSVATAGGGIVGDIYIEVLGASGDNPVIESTGYVPNITASDRVEKKVRVQLQSVGYKPFKSLLFSNSKVELSGQAFTDSYDSRLGDYGAALGGGSTNKFSNGNASTNGTAAGAISLSWQAIVKGNAGTGPEGTIEISDQAEVTGDQTHDIGMELPDVEVPSSLSGLSDGGILQLSGFSTQTLSPGNYKFQLIELSGATILTIEGPANIYLTGSSGKSINVSAQAVITCDGEVKFFCDQDVKISGQGVDNTGGIPADMIVYGTPTSDSFKYSGQSSFYGVVYAPDAVIEPSGQAAAYGAFVGKEIVISGQSGFHYDEALKDMELEGSPSGYSVVYWQQKE